MDCLVVMMITWGDFVIVSYLRWWRGWLMWRLVTALHFQKALQSNNCNQTMRGNQSNIYSIIYWHWYRFYGFYDIVLRYFLLFSPSLFTHSAIPCPSLHVIYLPPSLSIYTMYIMYIICICIHNIMYTLYIMYSMATLLPIGESPFFVTTKAETSLQPFSFSHNHCLLNIKHNLQILIILI